MSRRASRKPERKAEVLSAFVDYLLKTGMLDLSLRPAAAALRTSPRMLVYYFGSKERLLLAAIAEVRSRERARFARDIQRRRFGGSVARDVWVMWRWFSGKPREPYLRLFYELYARAASRPGRFKSFLDLGIYSSWRRGSPDGASRGRTRRLTPRCIWPRSGGCCWICSRPGSAPGSMPP